MRMKSRALMLLVFPVLLTACAGSVPRAISEKPANAPSVEVARSTDTGLSGTTVRWGGVIARVENRQTETWIEVVDRPLDRFGRPLETDASGGRFIARVQEFIDPQVHANGRLITVAGTLEKNTRRNIGDYLYTYPLVKADIIYLWPLLKDLPPYHYDPFWHDPWYPWGYPFYPRPYRR